MEGGDYQIIEGTTDTHFRRSVRKTITRRDGLASYLVMVHTIHSEMGPLVTSLIDFIIVFWNRFSGYASEAHVSGESRSDYPDGISTIYAFCPFFIIFQSTPEGNSYFLSACVRVAFEMKFYILFKSNRNKAGFHNRICPSPLFIVKVWLRPAAGVSAEPLLVAEDGSPVT